MKSFLLIISIIIFSLQVNSQGKNKSLNERSKIKNDNVLIVPDQKPVIIERTGDPVIPGKKQTKVIHKNNFPPGYAEKMHGAKSGKAFAPGQQKNVIKKKQKRKER